MKHITTVLLLLFFSFSGYTQTILLEQHVDSNEISNKIYGPNLRHYVFTNLGYGLVAGASGVSGLPVKYGSAREFIWAVKYKNRLNNVFSWGLGAHYSVQYFPIEQDSSKTYPNASLHKTERFTFNNLGSDLFFRINLNKERGNVSGTYIDFGGYIDWIFLTKYYTKDRNVPGTTSKYTETTQIGLTATPSFNHGVAISLGLKNIGFFAKYRISNTFIERYNVPELPRFLFGIVFST